jgi:hypothetical protein
MFGLTLAITIIAGVLFVMNAVTFLSMVGRDSPEAIGGFNSLVGSFLSLAAFVVALVACCLGG